MAPFLERAGPVAFLSLALEDGVLSLKLDLLFFRPRKAKKKAAAAPALKGLKPAPPPFPLPPLKSATPFDVLCDAPALRDTGAARAGYTRVEPVEPAEPTRAAPDAGATLVDDDVTYAPPKTSLAQQRRDVRKALRAAMK